MRKSKTVAVTAALAMMATPAFAQGQGQQPTGQGQATSPAKQCSKLGLSKKKVPGTKGQSAWAKCVSGMAKAKNDAEQAKTENRELKSPGTICRSMNPVPSRKKAPGTSKSPWAGCIAGVVEAQRKLREQS